METNLLSHNNLNQFFTSRESEILEIAQNNTKEIVKTELALMDFELLLSTDLIGKEINSLNNKSRSLREECWTELNKKFNNDHNKIMQFLNEF